MLIKEVRAFQPSTPGSPPDWRTQLGQIVVEIETDTGLQGIGVGGGGKAGVHVVETVLRDLLIGKPADEVEVRHAEMLAHTVFYGRKGIVVMAISGVDLALWDVRGKAAGKAVAELLAAPDVDWQRSLPTYVTVFDEDDAERALASGHQAIKLHVERFSDRPRPEDVAAYVGEVRRRLGHEASIMIDAFGRWDLATSLAVADAIAPHDVSWLEEPLPPDDLPGYEELVARSPVPIAGGEHEYTSAGFQELLDRHVHAVLQPDVNWCGGLTTLIDIYERARSYGVLVCPHRGSEPFALHAIAALDEQPLAESPRQWFQCLDGAPQISSGRIQVSPCHGFGVSCRTSESREPR